MSTSQLPVPGSHAADIRRRDLRRGWIAVALIPVGLVVAMVVGEGLVAALGYSEFETPPLLVALAISLPLIALAAAPAVGAVVYGRRVVRGGDGAGWGPRVIGWLAIAYWAVTTVSAIVLRLLE